MNKVIDGLLYPRKNLSFIEYPFLKIHTNSHYFRINRLNFSYRSIILHN